MLSSVNIYKCMEHVLHILQKTIETAGSESELSKSQDEYHCSKKEVPQYLARYIIFMPT